jgi:hypothetical protein
VYLKLTGVINTFLQEKAAESTKQKYEKRKKTKLKEQEGMPQHQLYYQHMC